MMVTPHVALEAVLIAKGANDNVDVAGAAGGASACPAQARES